MQIQKVIQKSHDMLCFLKEELTVSGDTSYAILQIYHVKFYILIWCQHFKEEYTYKRGRAAKVYKLDSWETKFVV